VGAALHFKAKKKIAFKKKTRWHKIKTKNLIMGI